LCCLPDRLEAAVVAVADVVGMEGLSATVLSVAGAAPELSDRASEPYNKWNDASPVTALTAVTMSACSGFDKVGMHIEDCLPGNVDRYVNILRP